MPVSNLQGGDATDRGCGRALRRNRIAGSQWLESPGGRYHRVALFYRPSMNVPRPTDFYASCPRKHFGEVPVSARVVGCPFRSRHLAIALGHSAVPPGRPTPAGTPLHAQPRPWAGLKNNRLSRAGSTRARFPSWPKL